MAKKRIIPVFIPHLGCPNQCVFCDQRTISGVARPVTPEIVHEQIAAALPSAGEYCELAFYGGSFTALPLRSQQDFFEAAAPFIHSGAVKSIRLSTRPDAINDTVCTIMKKYGVETVEIGCQSMDPEVLQLSRRGHTKEDTIYAVACLREHGFNVILQMMTGLPGDNGQQSIDTAKQIIALHPDGVRIYPTVVLSGTELEQRMNQGDYKPHTVQQAVYLCAVIYELFLEAGIPVIRLGLNPTDDLTGGKVVAGAYHPALGELVLSRMYLQRARELLTGKNGLNAVLSVHPKRISAMIGQKRCNTLTLQQEFGLQSLKILPEEEELWSISGTRW